MFVWYSSQTEFQKKYSFIHGHAKEKCVYQLVLTFS